MQPSDAETIVNNIVAFLDKLPGRLKTFILKHMPRLLSSVLLILSFASPRIPAQTLTITNATVVDVSTGALRRGTTVVIEGNRIVSVGPSSDDDSDHADRSSTRTGMYVIPGLWDMHTHAYFGWSTRLRRHVCAAALHRQRHHRHSRHGERSRRRAARTDEVAAHRLVGPRMVVSGPMLDGPHVTFKASIAIATPEDGRKGRRHAQEQGRRFHQDPIGCAARGLLRHRGRGEEAGHRVRRPRARCHPRVRSHRGRTANVRASHRHLRGEHARRRCVDQTQIRRGKGFVGQQEPCHISRSVRRRARGEHSSGFWRKTVCGNARRCSGNAVSGW